MNELFFACTACKLFIDAGFRHAYWTLVEPGVVCAGMPVDGVIIMEAEAYWHTEEECTRNLLKQVERFLIRHAGHPLLFGEAQQLELVPRYPGDTRPLDWLMEAGMAYVELPRFYVERLGFQHWQQVVAYLEQSRTQPWWWHDHADQEAARQKFLVLTNPNCYVNSNTTA